MVVTGNLDGIVYQVQITGDPSRPVVGSRRVAALLAQKANPGMPLDGERVLQLLQHHSNVTEVRGQDRVQRPRPLSGKP